MLMPTTPHAVVRSGWAGLCLVLATAGSSPATAGGPDVNFDFARLAEYRDVTPSERAARYPHERLIELKLPISVRFTGLAGGEVEHLDIEIDGSGAGLRVDSFSPATELASEATAIETINRTRTTRSLDGTLGGAVPVPLGSVVAHVAPSVSAGAVKTKEATEKINRLPPKQPVVVSGTFAQGQGVFFKFKRSTQTSFEGVHELAITFVAPAEWQGGNVRIACTARGHRPLLWLDQPTVFGSVVDNIELYSERDADGREAATRRAQSVQSSDDPAPCRWALFVEEAKAEIKKTAGSIADVDF